MRKQIINPDQHPTPEPGDWLDLEACAEVELSSEDPAHPIEHALSPDPDLAWRAAGPGEQRIRLLFDAPLSLRRILLEFQETDCVRTQEYLLRWSPDGGVGWREIRRQQWNFDPTGSTREREGHEVDLAEVTQLELIIVPDKSGGDAIASLSRLALA
jgi:hypothetical protein